MSDQVAVQKKAPPELPSPFWCEGWEAFTYDIGFGVNPYEAGTPAHAEWQAGYDYAEADQ